ncbi:MAG TPA: PAS domain-containing protein, partial [Terriglobales bacterium]
KMHVPLFQVQDPDNFYRAVVDAMPIPVFVLNSQVEILEMNEAARRLFTITDQDWKSRRAGEALRCLNAINSEKGCGHSERCSDCAIRNMVAACVSQGKQSQRRMFFERVEDGKLHELELLITCVQMPFARQDLTLLVVEDLTPLTQLKDLLPICMMCKSIRNDEQYWQSLESYFHENGVDFSHGICPSCRDRHYATFANQNETKGSI